MDQLTQIFTSRLQGTQFKSVNAERYKTGSSNGVLYCSVTVSLARDKENHKVAKAEVAVNVKGLPKDAPLDTNDVIFKVDVSVQGRYEWPVELPADDFSTEVTNALCQALFVVAIDRVHALMADMGAGRPTLDVDLRKIADHNLPEESSPEATRPAAAKRRGKKAA